MVTLAGDEPAVLEEARACTGKAGRHFSAGRVRSIVTTTAGWRVAGVKAMSAKRLLRGPRHRGAFPSLPLTGVRLAARVDWLPKPSSCGVNTDGRAPGRKGTMFRYSLVLVAGFWVAGSAGAATWADGLFDELSKDFGSVPRGPTLTHH